MVWWILGLAVAAVLAYGVWTYNRLVGLSKRADAAWSDIDVQLKRRWDLVPALVETVKGYAHHESSTLERVGRRGGRRCSPLRSPSAARASRISRRPSADSLRSLRAYPDLKASQNFQDLQRNLVEIENNIQYARRYYNAVVRDWNTLVEGIPSRWVAGAAGYSGRPYFQLDDELNAQRRAWHLGRRPPPAASRKRRRPRRASRVEIANKEDVVPRSHMFVQRFPAWTCVFLASVASGWGWVPARGDSGWTARTFNVTLEVRTDATLDVTELIDADFEVPKHGIYREIPIRYAVGMQQYALRFRLLGVDNGDGESYGTSVSYQDESCSDPHRRRGSHAQRSRPISHSLPRETGDSVGRHASLG